MEFNLKPEKVVSSPRPDGPIKWISSLPGNIPGDGESSNPNMKDGYIAYESDAGQVHLTHINDYNTNTVSVNNSGVIGDGFSYNPSVNTITEAGPFGSTTSPKVAYITNSRNLVLPDVNGAFDPIARIDKSFGGFGPSITSRIGPEGNRNTREVILGNEYTGITTDAANLLPVGDTYEDDASHTDAYMIHNSTGDVIRLSRGASVPNPDGDSELLDMTDDGELALFRSNATNIDLRAINGKYHLYLVDTDANNDGVHGDLEYTLLSINNDGGIADADIQNAFISEDGTKIAVETRADLLHGSPTGSFNLDEIYTKDLSDSAAEFVKEVWDNGNFKSLEDFDGRVIAYIDGGIPYLRDTQLGHNFPLNKNETGATVPGYTTEMSLDTDGSTVAIGTNMSLNSADPSGYDVYTLDGSCYAVTDLASTPDIDAYLEYDITTDGSDAVIHFPNGGLIHYDIHRSMDPYFTPDASTLIADNFDGTEYIDHGVVGAADSYYYKVAVEGCDDTLNVVSDHHEAVFNYPIVPGS